MKIYHLPEQISCLVFDIDQTLYRNDDYINSQYSLLVQQLAEHLGRPLAEVVTEFKELRQSYAVKNDGKIPSIGNLFRIHYDIPIEMNARWRADLFEPEKYLSEDVVLADVLARLGEQYTLCAVTNNDTKIGQRTLAALGVEQFFDLIIGLDMSLESKPTLKPFRMIEEHKRIPVGEMVSIGDRYAIDVELPLQNGIGGILVESMEDVYALGEHLL